MTTVLPTPAPPNAPTLPPLRNGQIRSMTLMPVVEHLRRRRLVDERRRRAVDRVALLRLDRPALVHRVAGDVEHAAHHAVADRHRDRPAGVGDLDAALEAFGAGHRDGAHPAVAEVLLHLEGQRDRLVLRPCSRPSARCRSAGSAVGKLDVHHRTDDLNDFADVHACSLLR